MSIQLHLHEVLRMYHCSVYTGEKFLCERVNQNGAGSHFLVQWEHSF